MKWRVLLCVGRFSGVHTTCNAFSIEYSSLKNKKKKESVWIFIFYYYPTRKRRFGSNDLNFNFLMNLNSGVKKTQRTMTLFSERGGFWTLMPVALLLISLNGLQAQLLTEKIPLGKRLWHYFMICFMNIILFWCFNLIQAKNWYRMWVRVGDLS